MVARLNIQTWRESAESFISRNSPPAVNHSNYKEETNSHRWMNGTHPANAACDTWKNHMSVYACLFGKFNTILSSFKTPSNEGSNVKSDVPNDLFQIGPGSWMRPRSCFPLTLARPSIAT